jgi:hypothetical protein
MSNYSNMTIQLFAYNLIMIGIELNSCFILLLLYKRLVLRYNNRKKMLRR